MGEGRSRPVVVAIDGPAGAGKSTIARLVAAKLGFTFIDSGAMYRAIAFWGLREGVDLNDHHKMEQLAVAADIALEPAGPGVRLNGEEITEAVRTEAVSAGASRVATIPGVRRALVEKQRALAAVTSVVMEGRDIGTVVFPAADVKIYLDADPAERAKRRFGDLGADASITTVTAQISERDQRDRTRAEAPLTQAPDAVYLDTTGMSLMETEQAVLKIVRERISNGKDFS
jgi:cytidylate kinase